MAYEASKDLIYIKTHVVLNKNLIFKEYLLF